MPLDIRIAGSGPVALAFALFARRLLGPHATLALDAAAAAPPPALAARPLAISHGSRLLVERVARFPPDAAPIRRIDIALSGLPGRVRLTADELDVPALGWVVRHGRLVQALRDALGAQPAAATAAAAADRSHDPRDRPDADRGHGPGDGANDGLRDAVQVVADGDTGDDADVRGHGQSAVLAEVTASQGAAGVAIERFTPDGPLALLPLPAEPGRPVRWALVWCADTALSDQRAALPRDAFEQALQRAFGDAFGTLALAAEPASVPLARRMRRAVAQGRMVWIGNAAQALHPVAGQGLNLGLRDAHELAGALGRAVQAGTPPEAALAAYARTRTADRGSMAFVTDALATGLRAPLVRPLQSAALALLDGTPALRTAVARGFMVGFA